MPNGRNSKDIVKVTTRVRVLEISSYFGLFATYDALCKIRCDTIYR